MFIYNGSLHQIQLIKSLIPRVPIYLYYVFKFMSIPEGPFMWTFNFLTSIYRNVESVETD